MFEISTLFALMAMLPLVATGFVMTHTPGTMTERTMHLQAHLVIMLTAITSPLLFNLKDEAMQDELFYFYLVFVTFTIFITMNHIYNFSRFPHKIEAIGVLYLAYTLYDLSQRIPAEEFVLGKFVTTSYVTFPVLHTLTPMIYGEFTNLQYGALHLINSTDYIARLYITPIIVSMYIVLTTLETPWKYLVVLISMGWYWYVEKFVTVHTDLSSLTAKEAFYQLMLQDSTIVKNSCLEVDSKDFTKDGQTYTVTRAGIDELLFGFVVQLTDLISSGSYIYSGNNNVEWHHPIFGNANYTLVTKSKWRQQDSENSKLTYRFKGHEGYFIQESIINGSRSSWLLLSPTAHSS
jgi:hypothetical protein